MKATILYKTDFYHRFDSREILGVFTNKTKLIATTKRIIKDDLNSDDQGRTKQELKDYINWNHQFLFEQNQTQGLNSFELVLEEIRLNEVDYKDLFTFL